MFDLGDRKTLRPCRARRRSAPAAAPAAPAPAGRARAPRSRYRSPRATAASQRWPATAARRWMKRDGTVGVPAILAAWLNITSRRAEELREVVRGEADAAFRQIEPERKPHRAAQPGVGIALGRPGAFDQAAEHDAVALGQTRFERPENAHAQVRLRRLPHDAARERGGKQFDIVGFGDAAGPRRLRWSRARQARRRGWCRRDRRSASSPPSCEDSAASTSRCRSANSLSGRCSRPISSSGSSASASQATSPAAAFNSASAEFSCADPMGADSACSCEMC